ncbi:MAG TPA: AraC family transcriptional regulator [Capsulimonadaceae bacterium]|jgi:AraC-like DNA-binding protein
MASIATFVSYSVMVNNYFYTDRAAAIADNIHVRLFEARTQPIDAAWNTPDVQSTYWRLYLNAADGASLILSDQTYPLRAGRLYFVPAGVHFSCSNTMTLEHFYIHFDLLQMPLAAMTVLFSSPLELPAGSDVQIEASEIAQSLKAIHATDLRMHFRLKGLIYNSLARYLEGLTDEQTSALARLVTALAPLQPALDHIERDPAARLRNDDLAALCCMSEDHFIRRFRQSLGDTPANYIQQRRVTLAAQQLLFTDASIEAIADSTGFGNRYYFTRVFTRRIGLSPAAYRGMSHGR